MGDLCRAILRALESDVSGEVFQVARGSETSIIDLAGMDQDVEMHHAAQAGGHWQELLGYRQGVGDAGLETEGEASRRVSRDMALAHELDHVEG